MDLIIRIKTDFKKAANPGKAALLARFFKTGKGEYAEGDRFHGLTVPQTRLLSKKYGALPLSRLKRLLNSPWHEERLCALLMLVENFRCGTEKEKAVIYHFYLGNTRYINNWDLVDLSAPRIVGGWLADKSKAPLFTLARSKDLWEKRVSIIACFEFIYAGRAEPALKIIKIHLRDPHDLIHKAAGWMLREIGKRCSEKILLDFLKKNYHALPRTTLRYAIEKFPPAKRARLLAGNFSG